MKQVSLYLKEILNNNPAIKAACGKRIYPIAAPAGVADFPFVTFEHSSMPNTGTKDGTTRIVDATISVVARTALQAEELADSILPAMYSWYEDTEKNTFLTTFSEPEFGSEKETYVVGVDAFVVGLSINFETL